MNRWIREVAEMCQPGQIYWCNGTQEGYRALMAQMVVAGSATPLEKRANSFLFRSDPSDVARVEARTYISTSSRDDAGPTNNWIDPEELKRTLRGLYNGCMRGRTVYVIPFSMGPIDSPMARVVSNSPTVPTLSAICTL